MNDAYSFFIQFSDHYFFKLRAKRRTPRIEINLQDDIRSGTYLKNLENLAINFAHVLSVARPDVTQTGYPDSDTYFSWYDSTISTKFQNLR